MATNIDPLALARTMAAAHGRGTWSVPRLFGTDGWIMGTAGRERSLIVTCADDDDGVDWIHASLTGEHDVPSYADLKVLHRAAFDAGWAYQVFAPPSDHVNIHDRALHLFGRADGRPVLPDFTMGKGSI